MGGSSSEDCAAQADRTISLRGAPVRGAIERLDDDAELLAQPLPDETTWTKARERAAEVFGLVPSEVRKGATVARLASELREKAHAARASLATLTSVLRTRMAAASVTPENAPRMITVLSASVLVTELTAGIEPLTVVQSLATSDLRTSEAAVGRSISAASGLASFLASFEWDVLAAATALSDHRRAAAEQIGRSVAEALEADEHVIPLEARLREAQRNAFRLLAAAAPSGGGAGAGASGQPGTATPGMAAPRRRRAWQRLRWLQSELLRSWRRGPGTFFRLKMQRRNLTVCSLASARNPARGCRSHGGSHGMVEKGEPTPRTFSTPA